MNEKNNKSEEQKTRVERVLRRISKTKIIKGVKDLLISRFGDTEEKKIVVEKEEVLKIIPYSKNIIFLDRIEITDGRVTGEFEITKEACAGHEIGGQPIFRAVDIEEMVTQFLGVWAAQFSELKDNKSAFFSEVDFEVTAKFIKAAFPGQVLIAEAEKLKKLKLSKEEEEQLTEEEKEERKKNPKLIISGRPDRPIRRVIGEDIVVKIKGEGDKSAAIQWISLKITDELS